jgi:hypothetical protein
LSQLVWKYTIFYGKLRITALFTTVKISGLNRMNPSYLTFYVCKGTVVPTHPISSAPSLTSALRGESSASGLGHFTVEKELPVSLNGMLGGLQSQSGRFGEQTTPLFL